MYVTNDFKSSNKRLHNTVIVSMRPLWLFITPFGHFCYVSRAFTPKIIIGQMCLQTQRLWLNRSLVINNWKVLASLRDARQPDWRSGFLFSAWTARWCWMQIGNSGIFCKHVHCSPIFCNFSNPLDILLVNIISVSAKFEWWSSRRRISRFRLYRVFYWVFVEDVQANASN